MNREQLEMSFAGSIAFRPALRPRRLTRARWWFAQMRQVVDGARDSGPTPHAGTEQVCPATRGPMQRSLNA